MTTRLALCLVWFGITTAANAQVLWQTTEFGMTVDQVRELVPMAKPSKTRDTLGSGAVKLLAIEEFTLVSRPFEVGFYFADQKLVQVTVSAKNLDSYSKASQVYESLLVVLRSKFGPEISSRRETGLFKLAETAWKAGKTNIGLLLVGVANTMTLNIHYQVRLHEESEKL